MADEDEVERFEITERDLENEFNINRKYRKLTKHQQIYGIWADESDEEREEKQRPGFGSGRGRKDYSAPVSFISGGVHQVGKKKEAKHEEVKKEESDDEYENENTSRRSPVGSSSDEEEEVRQPKYEKKNKRLFLQEDDIAGLRKRNTGAGLVKKGVGNWERHTKGIGAKLLLQMGYQPGRGLGKDLQGIAAPIEAAKRKGRGAIGAYGPEVKQRVAHVELDEEGEEVTQPLKPSQWRRTDGKKQKVQYVYRSVEDVLEDGKTRRIYKDDSALSRVKVIDMTGPEQRVLSGYHAISGQQRPADEWIEAQKSKRFTNFALPELAHNLALLVDICEQDIIRNDRDCRYKKDRIVACEKEDKSLDELCTVQEKQIGTLQSVLNTVEELQSNPPTLKEALIIFRRIQEDHYEEFRMYELGCLAVGLITPMFKEHLNGWNPIASPQEPIPLFKDWKTLLEGMGTDQDPYQTLLWEAWLPKVRVTVNLWECRKCDPMIELLEIWLPLMPTWIFENILDQLILPRIEKEVQSWNPLTDTVPIHAWIHPWLPLMGSRLEVVYPVIRQKLSNALVSWHPSDISARLMLTPWTGVFSPGSLNAFITKNIVPKLQLALQELVINPHQQHLDQWNWVMEWKDLIPPSSMAPILKNHFFPKWLQVLTVWLNHSPNYEEVSNWYCGWKSMFPEVLLAEPSVQEYFRRALDMMNRAVSASAAMAPPPPGMVDPMGFLGRLDAPPPPPPPPITANRIEMNVADRRQMMSGPQGFRELVEKRCEERGLVFFPIPNRWWEGKQIIRCGKLQIYIDRSVIFYYREGSWLPTSLGELLEAA